MRWDELAGISFDLGGTLINDHGLPATLEIGDLLGLDLPAMRAYLSRDAKRVRESPADLAHRLASDFRRPDLDARLTLLLQRRCQLTMRPQPLPHAEEVLRELRQRGYRIAFLSNVLGAIAPRPPFQPFFHLADAVLLSCDTAHVKPEHAAFTDVEQALDLDASQLAHVGDSLSADIQGALAAGWRAVHLLARGNSGGYSSAPAPTGAWCRLTALPALLDMFPESSARTHARQRRPGR